MDFFEHQDNAYRSTRRLILLYVAAVILIVAAVYFVASMLFVGATIGSEGESAAVRLWNPELFAIVAGSTLLLIAAGTTYKTYALKGGGAAVATMLGGREIMSGSADADERRLINVVEEMAIASGTSAPRMFVLDTEESINAFAAGFTTSDAVIGVTRGCMRLLNRDQLQGVIAHEFSHIMNGDMRLNIRLMGVLHGILLIAMTGYWIFRITARPGRSSRRDKKDGNMLPVVLFGLSLMAIGYIGVFFARLIKSAVSRQREFLADASSVQFTRNPAGLSGALRKIAAHTSGSRLRAEAAETASHMFFGNGLSASWLSLMATHPPLEERIRRIDPAMDLTGSGAGAIGAADGTDARRVRNSGVSMAVGAMCGARAEAGPVCGAAGIAVTIGAPRAEHLAFAEAWKRDLPKAVGEALRTPESACRVAYCLLAGRSAGGSEAQRKILSERLGENEYALTMVLLPEVRRAGPRGRLALLDSAMPALRRMRSESYERFRSVVEALVMADGEVSPYEYAFHRVLCRHLDPNFHAVTAPAVQFRQIAQVLEPARVLLSSLARCGAGAGKPAEAVFADAWECLGSGVGSELAPEDGCTLAHVDKALEKLLRASPSVKKKLLKACSECVMSDGRITVDEAEMLRAVADSLDCPIPPILAAV